MSPTNFIILLFACSSVAVRGYRISRRWRCPPNAASLLESCTTGTRNPYYTDNHDEYCATLRQAMRCVQSLQTECSGTRDAAFQQIIKSLPFSPLSIRRECGGY